MPKNAPEKHFVRNKSSMTAPLSRFMGLTHPENEHEQITACETNPGSY